MAGDGSRRRRMRWTVAVLSTAALMIVSLGAFVLAETVTTADGKRHRWTVLKVSDAGVLIRSAVGGGKLIRWDELEAKSAYAYRRRLVKEGDAADHVGLMEFCIARELWKEARRAAEIAKKLDPKLISRIDNLWARANGERRGRKLSREQAETVLKEQRGRARRIRDIVAGPVTMLETDHFIIYTTFPKGDHKLFRKTCEKLHRGFDRVFEISARQDRMWSGKAVVYLFKERKEFVAFSNDMHKYPGQTAGGYFRAQGGQCEIVIPKNGDLDDFLETLVHEGAHAFLHFYRDPGHIPKWVHEGVAQYFQFDEFPKGRHARRALRVVKNDLKRGKPLSLVELAHDDRPQTGMDFVGYAYAHSYVNFLVETSGRKFAEFIRGLKSGMKPQDALKKAYGWDFATTQRKWADAMTKKHGER